MRKKDRKRIWFIVGGAVFFLLALFLILNPGKRPGAESITLSIAPAPTSTPGGTVANGTISATAAKPARAVSAADDPLSAIRAIPGTSDFVALLESTGVASQLSVHGTYTFFVPTNTAFRSSPLGLVSSLSFADRQRLAEYHIVVGKTMSVSAMKAGYITMMSRDALNANVFDIAQVGGNTHVAGTYPAKNGIIYVIDRMLLPPVVRPFPF